MPIIWFSLSSNQSPTPFPLTSLSKPTSTSTRLSSAQLVGCPFLGKIQFSFWKANELFSQPRVALRLRLRSCCFGHLAKVQARRRQNLSKIRSKGKGRKKNNKKRFSLNCHFHCCCCCYFLCLLRAHKLNLKLKMWHKVWPRVAQLVQMWTSCQEGIDFISSGLL